MVRLKNVLDAKDLIAVKRQLASASWTDGRLTAGWQARTVKNNEQISGDDAGLLSLTEIISKALNHHKEFQFAARPKQFVPLFSADIKRGWRMATTSIIRSFTGCEQTFLPTRRIGFLTLSLIFVFAIPCPASAAAPSLDALSLDGLFSNEDIQTNSKSLGCRELSEQEALNKSNTAQFYFARGISYASKHNYDCAIINFDKAISIGPPASSILIAQGFAYANKGEYGRAIAYIDDALALDVHGQEALFAHFIRGLAYDNIGKYDESIVDFAEAIKIKPDYAASFYWRGSAYSSKGDYEHAIADFDKAIALNSTDSRSLYWRGAAYLSQNRYDQTLADFEKSIAIDPRNYKAFLGRAYIYLDRHDYQSAIADYDKAILLRPGFSGGYLSRGILFEVTGEYARAVSDFDKVLELKPGEPAAVRHRALAIDGARKAKLNHP